MVPTLLEKTNLGTDKLGVLVPILTTFLKSRLEGGTLEKVMGFLPMLQGLAGGDAKGMLGGVLGGLTR